MYRCGMFRHSVPGMTDVAQGMIGDAVQVDESLVVNV